MKRTQWLPIESAPRGQTKTVGEGKQKRNIFVPDRVWTMRDSDGHITASEWIPSESRWDFYTADRGPTHWQPYRSAIALLVENEHLFLQVTA